ncbi:hypothetical protein SAMN05192564_107318 [Paraburkholderia sartisoli]|uniref:Uncharacterized protein n=1 Tax=Paraburkholderia sartisoli TaxID=83784 RepID=A0A1H4H871_9BURK|nr:hypothetical protein SAMN05192564_107318 [Paraburkholderia sartisoli]
MCAIVFGLDEIRDAHRVMEASEVGGKTVVVHCHR